MKELIPLIFGAVTLLIINAAMLCGVVWLIVLLLRSMGVIS